jgi:hypothetical protein
MQKVSKYIERCVDPPSRNLIDNGVKGNTTARRLALDILVAENYVSTEDGARNATLFRSVKPYRQDDDPTTSPTSPDLASTSPLGGVEHFAHLAPTPEGGRALGEVEVTQDEIERLAALAREHEDAA